MGHKPKHGKKRPTKVVKIGIIIVRIPFGVFALKIFRTGTRWKQGNRGGITFPAGQLPSHHLPIPAKTPALLRATDSYGEVLGAEYL